MATTSCPPRSDIGPPRSGIRYPTFGHHHCPFCGTPTKALWELSYDTGMLRVGERLLRLTPTEADILAALSSPPGRVLSTNRLIMRVWGGAEPAAADHALWVHIFTLRRRLRASGGCLAVAYLRGRGYVLLQERYEPPGSEEHGTAPYTGSPGDEPGGEPAGGEAGDEGQKTEGSSSDI